MTAKPYTPEERAALPHYSVMAYGPERDAARLMATCDALEAELARYKAAVPADVAGLVTRLRDEEAFVLIAKDEYVLTREAADKLEAQARELAAKDACAKLVADLAESCCSCEHYTRVIGASPRVYEPAVRVCGSCRARALVTP